MSHASSPPPTPPLHPREHGSPREIASDALLGGRRELVIMHGSERYVLRQTRQGKLILTK
ncbi:Hemin uptake protein HemP [Faunimonas pinastri]|uniref:Hemin uptake protein HemP n=1 Tax=Faunimonas pinastri TaxID=1855383 RepID=A0A1H9LZW7_9HYPH|nr:hemin uptake protein HemP [Faunimonas pinastri]SER16962.1 Hemin uptake protein HemP [Faunimonas pinastri]